MTRSRHALAAAVTVAALAAVSGCGAHASGGPRAAAEDRPGGSAAASVSATAISDLRAAQSSTRRAKSAAVEAEMTVGTGTMTISGALDWSGGLVGDLRMRQKGGLANKLAAMGSKGAYEVRYLRDAMYVNLGVHLPGPYADKTWLRYDYATLARMSGTSGAFSNDELRSADPNTTVQMLIASGQVKRVGTDSVRGVRATHYAGTVDVLALSRSRSGLSAQELDRIRRQAQQAGITTEQVDVWVGADKLMVKESQRAATKAGEFTSTSYYSGYGTQVSATPPPASQTLDFTALLGARGRTPGQQAGAASVPGAIRTA